MQPHAAPSRAVCYATTSPYKPQRAPKQNKTKPQTQEARPKASIGDRSSNSKIAVGLQPRSLSNEAASRLRENLLRVSNIFSRVLVQQNCSLGCPPAVPFTLRLPSSGILATLTARCSSHHTPCGPSRVPRQGSYVSTW